MDYFGNVFFMMRHGEADHNVGNFIASDEVEKSARQPKLTENGVRDAESAAEELVGKGIDIIYSSPYKRTMQTAGIVGEKLGLEVNSDIRLGELDMGVLDGEPLDKYRKFFSNNDDRYSRAPEGGENFSDLMERTGEFLKDILVKHKNEEILIVSHGDTLWVMESILLGEERDVSSVPYHKTGELIRFPSLKTE